ncbi:hypothetical protein [Streptomyces sp. NPDC050564]|uniref:hypothetical protein n=1 Tax=Streptomyces sp. NPDC050564 TaxID=3365631 RepID=UPI0037B61284
MTTTAGRRRRVWRWAAAVWTVAVVVGGGLTLWLQDSAEPQGPRVWEQNKDHRKVPAPLLRYDDLPSSCPRVEDGEDGICAYATLGW